LDRPVGASQSFYLFHITSKLPLKVTYQFCKVDTIYQCKARRPLFDTELLKAFWVECRRETLFREKVSQTCSQWKETFSVEGLSIFGPIWMRG